MRKSCRFSAENIEILKTVTIATTACMLLAHMYVFTNGSLLFDSGGVYRGEPIWHYISDKWLVHAYWLMDWGVNCPWLSGVWATLLMIISVYCIVETLNIETTIGIVLTAGICSTQTSIICQQEYTGQGFYGIIALMWAALAAYLISTSNGKSARVVLGGICIIFSAATYSAYVGVASSLLIFKIIEEMLGTKTEQRDNTNTFVLTIK